MLYIYFLRYFFSYNTPEETDNDDFIRLYVKDNSDIQTAFVFCTAINKALYYKKLLKKLSLRMYFLNIIKISHEIDNDECLLMFMKRFEELKGWLLFHKKFNFIHSYSNYVELYKKRFIYNYIKLELRKVPLIEMMSFVQFCESFNLDEIDDFRCKNMLNFYITQIANSVNIYSKLFYELRVVYFCFLL